MTRGNTHRRSSNKNDTKLLNIFVDPVGIIFTRVDAWQYMYGHQYLACIVSEGLD